MEGEGRRQRSCGRESSSPHNYGRDIVAFWIHDQYRIPELLENTGSSWRSGLTDYIAPHIITA